MEEMIIEKDTKRETRSIVIVLLLIILGGIFYGVDLYRKTKVPVALVTQDVVPAQPQ